MYTLDFRDGLIAHPFSFNNSYTYDDRELLGFRLNKEWDQELYITRAMLGTTRIHDEDHLTYSKYDNQLMGRTITALKLREILDSAKMPILIKSTEGAKYLIGKGFLARYHSRRRIRILLAACVFKGVRITNISQVKYYVGRDLYMDENKKVATAVSDMLDAHTGDVITTQDPMTYIGKTSPLIAVGSLREKKEMIDKIFDRWMIAG
jgi:hypothetical protein